MKKKSKHFYLIACALLVAVVAAVLAIAAFSQKDTSTLEMHNPPAVTEEYAQLIYRPRYGTGSYIDDMSSLEYSGGSDVTLYSTASEALQNPFIFAANLNERMAIHGFKVHFLFTGLNKVESLNTTLISAQNVGGISSNSNQKVDDIWVGSICIKTSVIDWLDKNGFVDELSHMRLESFVVEVVYESTQGNREHAFMAFEISRT